MVAGLAVVALAGGDIQVALSALFLGPISAGFGIQQIFVRFVALYTIGMGIGLALKAGLWNIGGQGQLIIGMCTVFVLYDFLRSTPAPILFFLMLSGSALAGLLWIVVPTILKIKFGANEIVVTLLLNVVALNLATYLLNGPIKGAQSFGYPITDNLPPSLQLPVLVPGYGLTIAVPLTISLAVILYLLVEKTPFGVRADTVGESVETARYAGISITRVQMTVMLSAGALAGLAGATYVMGFLNHLDAGQFENNFGYLSIIVAMLGRKSVLGIGIASAFFGYFTIGAEEMAQATHLQTLIVLVMEGMMLFGILVTSYLSKRGVGRS